MAQRVEDEAWVQLATRIPKPLHRELPAPTVDPHSGITRRYTNNSQVMIARNEEHVSPHV